MQSHPHTHDHPRHPHPFADPEFVEALLERRRFNRGPGMGPGFGGGPFGPGFGGPRGRGGFGGPRGRARRGQIRSALLALLVEQPMHGYEMIRQIEERSGGRWKPSPGAVYPTLQQLEDEGLVTADADAGKRVFSLTAEGRQVAESLPEAEAAPWDEEGDVHPAWELKPLVKQLAMAAGAAMSGTPEQAERAKTVLVEARRKLYAILAEEEGEPVGEPTAE